MRNGPLLQLLLMSDAIQRGTGGADLLLVGNSVGKTHAGMAGVAADLDRFAEIHLPTPKVDPFGSWWGRPDVPRVRRAALPPPPEKPLTGPISRVCPRCGAAAGKGCSRDGSYRLSRKHRFHKSRMDK